jgi:hypothetical protein
MELHGIRYITPIVECSRFYQSQHEADKRLRRIVAEYLDLQWQQTSPMEKYTPRLETP